MIERYDWGTHLTCRKQNRYSTRHRFTGGSTHLILLSLVLTSGLATVSCTHPAPTANNQGNANQNTAQSKSANGNIAARPEQKTTGSIEITSSPAGARVLLVPTDEGGAGEPQPKGVSPTTITGVAPGKYTLNLEKPGYRFFQKEVNVKAGSAAKVIATLKKH